MTEYRIIKGFDIPLKGAAEPRIDKESLPGQVAFYPREFRGLRLRLLVKEGDPVQAGTPVLEDKDNPQIKIVSPVAGKVAEIRRGEKRSLQAVVISVLNAPAAVPFRKYSEPELAALSRGEIVEQLLAGGVWPCLRQRPFSTVADPTTHPKAVFVTAMKTGPLAPDVDLILRGKEKIFQLGLAVLKKLTDGDVHLCCRPEVKSPALTQARGVKVHHFRGAHPAGNVGTHIHLIDPIRRGETVWSIDAQDVLRIAAFFLEGAFPAERVVAVTGEGAAAKIYRKTVLGAALSSFAKPQRAGGIRFLSGNVLAGTDVGPQGYLGYYDSQVTLIPEGGRREFLGWLWPGFNKFSLSRMFASPLVKKAGEGLSLDSDLHGAPRPIVLNDVFDRYVVLDVLTFPLLRSVLAKNWEEAEQLGLLECDEEDFALASFVCPSKTDVGGIIRQGLEAFRQEG